MGFPLWAWGLQQHLMHEWLLKLNRRTGFLKQVLRQKFDYRPWCLLFCFHVDLGFTQPLLGFSPVTTFETTFSICCGEEEKRFPKVPVDVVRDPFSTSFTEWWHWCAVAGLGFSLDAQRVEDCPSSHDPLTGVCEVLKTCQHCHPLGWMLEWWGASVEKPPWDMKSRYIC